MTVSGDSLKFQGASEQDRYCGKLVLKPNTEPNQADLVIQDCGAPQYVGMTCKTIYKLEGKTLTIAGTEPGSEAGPASFERGSDSQWRVIVFNRQ